MRGRSVSSSPRYQGVLFRLARWLGDAEPTWACLVTKMRLWAVSSIGQSEVEGSSDALALGSDIADRTARSSCSMSAHLCIEGC